MERELPICLLLRTGARILFDVDCNLLRYHERLEGKVLGIAQHKLKRVFPWRQFDACLRLPSPEMKMFFVLRNCIVRIERFIHVYQQMVMTGVWKTEAAPKTSFNNRAILRPYKVKIGIVRADFPCKNAAVGNRDDATIVTRAIKTFRIRLFL
jgi:hypothetical protein